MSLNPQRLQAIRDIVRDRMVQSGVDNYAFVDDKLKIGSTHYAMEACGCGEPECDGVRLRRVHQGFQFYQAQVDVGISFGQAPGTA